MLRGGTRYRVTVWIMHLSHCGWVVLSLAPGGRAADNPPENASAVVEHPLALTQLPVQRANKREPRAGGTLRFDYGEGARLIVVQPDGSTKVLSEVFHSACDPAVSFDGTRLLFAGKRAPADSWDIYEITLADSSVRRITRDLGDCRGPGYQGSLYTLRPVGVPSEPEYHLTFVASTGAMNESGDSAATSLYSCKFDGTAVRRLTFNLSSDLDSCILPDGRLVFASWRQSRLDLGSGGYIGLFGINIDGSDYAGFTTGQGKRIQRMPCVTTRGLVVFVEADEVGWDGAGSLASVTLRRPLHSYRTLTSTDQGLFHSPSPLPDGRLLVSRRSPRRGAPLRAGGADTYEVCVFDPDRGQIALVFDDPQWHDVQAKAIYARPEPDGRSTAVPEEPGASARTGRLYCLNVYASDLKPSWLPPGSVKGLRVLEGVAAPGGSESIPAGIPHLVRRRILGEVPIEQDGSFNVEIPANMPIELQILDSDGMALRSCGWIWAKDYARQGCIGCHEDPEMTPENAMVEAVQRPSIKLTLPPAERRTVDFRHDVMPIVVGKCVGCHAGTDAPVHFTEEMSPLVGSEGTAYFNRTYESLLAPGREAQRGRYVHPGRARTSPLIWRLYGRNTSRAWDEAGPVKPLGRMPPEGAAALTEHEKRTLVEWIDMGALWNGIPVIPASVAEDHDGGPSR